MPNKKPLKIRKKIFTISKAVKPGDAQNWIPFYCELCATKLRATEKEFRSIKPCPSCQKEITYPDPSFGVGQLIADYMIDGWISYGSMGEVYMAHNVNTKRKVALKILNSQISTEDGKKLFEQEGDILSYFRHENILKESSKGTFSGCHYIALEYVEGECIDTILKRAEKLDEDLVLSIIEQTANALDYAWEHFGIMHRDIKPGNLMIEANGHLTLIDWGMAKQKFHNADTEVFGSPMFMDPVCIQQNTNLDSRSDIYSLGVTAFHLLTGDYPYFDEDVEHLIDKVLGTPTPMVTDFNPDVSTNTAQLLYYMMSKTYETRYQGWSEVINGVKEVFASRK